MKKNYPYCAAISEYNIQQRNRLYHIRIGKDATTDGSTIVTHTCDSTGDDTRMWIIPRMEGGPDVKTL